MRHPTRILRHSSPPSPGPLHPCPGNDMLNDRARKHQRLCTYSFVFSTSRSGPFSIIWWMSAVRPCAAASGQNTTQDDVLASPSACCIRVLIFYAWNDAERGSRQRWSLMCESSNSCAGGLGVSLPWTRSVNVSGQCRLCAHPPGVGFDFCKQLICCSVACPAPTHLNTHTPAPSACEVPLSHALSHVSMFFRAGPMNNLDRSVATSFASVVCGDGFPVFVSASRGHAPIFFLRPPQCVTTVQHCCGVYKQLCVKVDDKVLFLVGTGNGSICCSVAAQFEKYHKIVNARHVLFVWFRCDANLLYCSVYWSSHGAPKTLVWNPEK